MDLYGKQSKSIPQKTIITLLEIFLLYFSFWLLFQGGSIWITELLGINNGSGNELRRWVVFIFNMIIFLRLTYMMFFLLKRKIPWSECLSVPFAFALYFIGFAVLVLPTEKALDSIDAIGIFIFLVGCWLNTGGEILRDRWKRNPANKGKIYTQGYFRYARHINYFGDLLWVAGYAILTRNWWSILIPIMLFLFFAFFNAPKLDRYLKEKYGEGYETYARKVKILIPFIY